MPKLIITDRSGKKSEIEYDINFTLMETLRDNGYDIEASCGGCCACATCHVYIDEKWTNKLKNMDDDEESMLDQAFDVKNNSRLSCQIELSEELDGLEIEIAPEAANGEKYVGNYIMVHIIFSSGAKYWNSLES